MSHNILLEGSKPIRLTTAGKYCDRDIIVTPENLDDKLTQQDVLIEQIKAALQGKGSGGGSDGLPTGYKSVDFIEFSGKQLIDTGIVGNQDTQIRAIFTWGSSTQNHLFGCASPDNTKAITSYMNGSWRFGAKSATKSISKNNTLLPYSAYVNKSIIGVTGSSTSISDVADFETIGTLLLGGARSSSGELPGSGLVGRVFSFYLWQGDTQVLKLIPVVDENGVYRFWDIIGKTFYDSITDTPLGGGNL